MEERRKEKEREVEWSLYFIRAGAPLPSNFRYAVGGGWCLVMAAGPPMICAVYGTKRHRKEGRRYYKRVEANGTGCWFSSKRKSVRC